MDADIRPERPEDAEGIEAVTVAAFLDAAHTSHTEQFIVRELRRAGHLTVSLVADFRGRVIGHVAISPVTISDGTRDWFGLGPVSVSPEHQRRGLGSRLVREGLARLKALGGRGCVLVGEPAYYGRFGFRAEPGLVLPGVPSQYFQAVCLAGPMPAGTVTFDAAFEAKE
ncbi:MAG TPA: N-acetyltransferase [Steroidobacteraceae bacterium]|nr:N-acetyltransferase [Steroidobacteraceae bacterium]